MTKKTEALAIEIKNAQEKYNETVVLPKEQNGYQIFSEILINLLGSIIVACALGVFCQNVFHTPVLFTICLTTFGAFAGLYSVVRTMMYMDKKDK